MQVSMATDDPPPPPSGPPPLGPQGPYDPYRPYDPYQPPDGMPPPSGRPRSNTTVIVVITLAAVVAVALVTTAILLPPDAVGFERLTSEVYREPPPRNQLAIVVDGKVISSPAVRGPIVGGRLQIEGNFTKGAAKHLADQLEG